MWIPFSGKWPTANMPAWQWPIEPRSVLQVQTSVVDRGYTQQVCRGLDTYSSSTRKENEQTKEQQHSRRSGNGKISFKPKTKTVLDPYPTLHQVSFQKCQTQTPQKNTTWGEKTTQRSFATLLYATVNCQKAGQFWPTSSFAEPLDEARVLTGPLDKVCETRTGIKLLIALLFEANSCL